MQSIIFLLDFFVSSLLTVVSSFVYLIVTDPLLSLFVLLSFCGLGLTLIRRIIS